MSYGASLFERPLMLVEILQLHASLYISLDRMFLGACLAAACAHQYKDTCKHTPPTFVDGPHYHPTSSSCAADVDLSAVVEVQLYGCYWAWHLQDLDDKDSKHARSRSCLRAIIYPVLRVSACMLCSVHKYLIDAPH